ncbi:hypothetical protein [Roseibium polysiphoniae]|uniref:Uncharacterized protein n=1 Tax=Roseibium polysiphoniae TaxID=2571221 RepID=A0ABR9C663_9HYPH|nr:hypothetical protein [Roseibium polysiphoniae]MBD8875416.1 hypothetical protein [Roseibium polysiphoniae]
MQGLSAPTLDRATCSPYRAEGTVVFKMASKVACRTGSIRFLSHRICTVNEDVEDPVAAAKMLAEALNAHALLTATRPPNGKTAVTYWLHAYMSALTIPHPDPNDWLAAHRDAQERAAQLVARHGLIALILEASKHLANSWPDPKR